MEWNKYSIYITQIFCQSQKIYIEYSRVTI